MSHYYEEDRMATYEDAEREYVDSVGSLCEERCWILSPRDVWYRNPHFKGEATIHPENDYEHYHQFDDETET